MKYLALLLTSLSCSGCLAGPSADHMALMFSTYWSSPVVVTHFAIEGPIGEIHPEIPGGRADNGGARSAGAALLGAPMDVGGDGLWHLSAQWVELPTDKAWRAEVDIPVEKLTVSRSSYQLNVIFGPNGLLLIGSDKIGNTPADHVDIVRSCGQRVPAADEKWRLKTGHFPGLPIIMKDLPTVTSPECPFPKR